MRVEVEMLDELSNPASGGATTLSFYDNEELQNYIESGVALDGSGIATFQNGTGNANITIQPLWLAGPVTTIATWTNGTSVGEIRKYFYIYHRTSLEVESAVYTAFRGDSVTIRGPRFEPPIPILTRWEIFFPVYPFHSPERILPEKTFIFSSTPFT